MESTSAIVAVLAAPLLLLTAVAAHPTLTAVAAARAAPAPPRAIPTTTAGLYTCSSEECKLTEPHKATRNNCLSLCNDPNQLVVFRDIGNKNDESNPCELLPFTKTHVPFPTSDVSKEICKAEHFRLGILEGMIQVWHLVWDGVPNHEGNCSAPDTSLVYRSQCDTPKDCTKPRYRCAHHRKIHTTQDVTICFLGVDTHVDRCS